MNIAIAVGAASLAAPTAGLPQLLEPANVVGGHRLLAKGQLS
jgi:hypothetical protein